jgi:hypothetical protein
MTVDLLNLVFDTALILNDGHEVYARLSAGEDMVAVVRDLNQKFGKPENGRVIDAISNAWPPLHREAVTEMVRWAMGKLDTEDRVNIRWKGDADNPETVTRFELRGHELVIEFAHPPGSIQAGRNGA